MIDLDDVPPDVVQNEYSTQVDLYGLFCILMFFETMIALTVHVFYLFDWGWITWINWVSCIINNLGFCLYAVLCGDGTLTLARRSDTSTPGCAVLLDQHFMVVLNGNQSVIEAIAESGFNLSHPNLVWEFPFGREDHGRDSPYDLIEASCDGACLAAFAACWLLFHPTTTLGGAVPIIVISLIAVILQRTPPNHFSPPQDPWLVAKNLSCRLLPPMLFLLIYGQATIETSFFTFNWQREVTVIPILLLLIFSAGYKARNYPIRSAKFLDSLGHPPVRKWQFDTLAAAVTFQSLVLCRGIPRPIRSIDVLALLDLLIPDQRDLWKAWKARVADRIVHEMDILFTPTIPTFRDERQQQLNELLSEAQFGYDMYRRFYDRQMLQYAN